MDGDGTTETRAARAARLMADLVRDAAPGARLGTKEELRRRCGVSVGTFNETLRVVQSQGLVMVRPGPGGGLFAAEQSPMVRLGHSVLALACDGAPVADAVRIRDALDPLIFADAARHSSATDVANYRAQVDAMAQAAAVLEPAAFMHANWRLHELLVAVNPSDMLRSLYLALLDLIRSRVVEFHTPDGVDPTEAMAQRHLVHAHLVEAIAANDVEELRRASAAHGVSRAHAADSPNPTAASR